MKIISYEVSSDCVIQDGSAYPQLTTPTCTSSDPLESLPFTTKGPPLSP